MAIFRFPSSWRDLAIPQFTKEMVARLEDRDQALEDYLTLVEPAPAASSSSGGIIAYMTYAPVGSTYDQNIPSGGISPVDSGFRLKVEFTVPDSGNVLVEMEAVVLPSVYDAICNYLTFAVWDAGTSSVVASALILSDTTLKTDNGSGYGTRVRCVIPVEGLTPGDTVTYWWAANRQMSSGNLHIEARAYDGSSGDDVPGPLFMAVHALP